MAIYEDPRMRLFADDKIVFRDVHPLFTNRDYEVFDRYSDGDDYEDVGYIYRFRMILYAIRSKKPLLITYENNREKKNKKLVLPQLLEYSQKDDKFRLICMGRRASFTINLGRISSCRICEREVSFCKSRRIRSREVTFELVDERGALERVMMAFAHFRKSASRIDDDRYRVTITYEKSDEIEVLIRILSFGPMIKVVEPEAYVHLIKQRLLRQKAVD